MIKFILRNNYFYRGEVLEETATKITMKDVKGNIVEINKADIMVTEVEKKKEMSLDKAGKILKGEADKDENL